MNGNAAPMGKSPSIDSSLVSPSPSMAGLGSSSLVGSPSGTPASGYFGHVTSTSSSRPLPISPSPVDKQRSASLRAESPKTGISDDGSFRTANDGAALADVQRNGGSGGSNVSSPSSTSPTVREMQQGASLDVPSTSAASGRSAKRRSINPQMVFDYQRTNASPPISPSHGNDVFSQSLSIALPNSPLRSVFGSNGGDQRDSPGGVSPRQVTAIVPPLKLANAVNRPGIDKEEGGWMASNRNASAYSSTPPRTSSLKDKARQAQDTPPTLDAPEIAALNFSSDPDFAVLLAENIRLESPEKAGAIKGHTPSTTESSHSGGTLRASQAPDRIASPSYIKRQSLSMPTSPSPPPKDGLPLPQASPSTTSRRKRSATDLVLRDQEVEIPQQTSRSLDLPPPPPHVRADSSSSAGSGDGADLQEVTNILQQAMDTAQSGDGRAQLDLSTLRQIAQYIGGIHEELHNTRQKYSSAKVSLWQIFSLRMILTHLYLPALEPTCHRWAVGGKRHLRERGGRQARS